MQINISRNKILINVVPKLHANKKESNSGRCNHCGGAFKNEFDMTVCVMCSRDSGHACSSCSHFPNEIDCEI